MLRLILIMQMLLNWSLDHAIKKVSVKSIMQLLTFQLGLKFHNLTTKIAYKHTRSAIVRAFFMTPFYTRITHNPTFF